MLKELEKQLELKEEEKSKLNEEIRELKFKILEEKTGVTIGDIVEYGDAKGVIINMNSYGSWNWRKIKKDGTLHMNSTYLSRYSTLKKIGVWTKNE